MEINDVSIASHTHGIPLKGWSAVVEAVNLFAFGGTRGSHDAVDHNVKEFDKLGGGGLGGAMFMMMNTMAGGGLGEFVQGILVKAEGSIKSRGRYHGSWDYDGPGPFHKASLDITLVDPEDEVYILTCSAAYVGDKPEEGLAEALNVTRGYSYVSVNCSVTAMDAKRFGFDMVEVCRILATVFPDQPWQGERLATSIIRGDDDRHEVLCYLGDGLRVTVGVANVGDESGWGYQAPLLVGPLMAKWRGEGMEVPLLVVSITSSEGERWSRAPIWQDGTKLRAMGLAEKFAKAFREAIPS